MLSEEEGYNLPFEVWASYGPRRTDRIHLPEAKYLDPSRSIEVMWLANHIFTNFPKDVTGLKLYVMDCGCIYFRNITREGALSSQVGIYRDQDDGECAVCMTQGKGWEERVVDQTVVYNSKFRIS
jgi:hypothetical protein